MSLTIEVTELKGLDLDRTPPCECGLMEEPPRQCGNPSVARVSFNCTCGCSAKLFVCALCLRKFQGTEVGKAFCGECKVPIDSSGSWSVI